MTDTPINSDSYARLPVWEQAQARSIAKSLREDCGAYDGSDTDALTDAVGIMRAARFGPPEGDNHHNAAVCPYCTRPPTDELRGLLQAWEPRVICPQCGERYTDRACGPTHAVVHALVWPEHFADPS